MESKSLLSEKCERFAEEDVKNIRQDNAYDGEYDNEIFIEFSSHGENEGFARMAVSAFIVALNPDMEELADLKTAVSEAVTNSVVHAYDDESGKISIRLSRQGNNVTVEVEDYGKGIEDIKQAMEPMFTTGKDSERSGMGFTFMELFTDTLSVESTKGKGTRVHMEKKIGRA